MTAFELLAYVVTFVLVLGLVMYLAVLIMLFVNRKKAMEDFNSNRERSKHKIDL